MKYDRSHLTIKMRRCDLLHFVVKCARKSLWDKKNRFECSIWQVSVMVT